MKFIPFLVYPSFSLLVQSSLFLETPSPTWIPLPPPPFFLQTPFLKLKCVCVCVCVRAGMLSHV